MPVSPTPRTPTTHRYPQLAGVNMPAAGHLQDVGLPRLAEKALDAYLVDLNSFYAEEMEVFRRRVWRWRRCGAENQGPQEHQGRQGQKPSVPAVPQVPSSFNSGSPTVTRSSSG
jgi:hypothetical protein